MTEPRKLSYLDGQAPSTQGEVVYYQDETAPPERAWRWKYVSADGHVVSRSEDAFKTRRGAMDEWNEIHAVVERLKKGR